MADTHLAPGYTGYCFIPPGIGIPDGYQDTQCSSPSEVLRSFLYFGLVSILLNSVFGYRAIRNWLGKWSPLHKRHRYGPPPLLPGIATVLIHLLVAGCVTGIVLKGGFDVSATMIFCLLLLRPRFIFVSQIVNVIGNTLSNKRLAYGALTLDLFLAEMVLEIINIYITLTFQNVGPSADPICVSIEMTNDQADDANWMKISARVLLGCGFAAGATLLIWIVAWLLAWHGGKEWDAGKEYSFFLIVVMACGQVLIMLTFIFSWVFWATFLELAGNAFCPSDLVALAVMIGFLPLISNLARAWVS